MRLQHITITDMAGFEGAHEFDLPAITIIQGPNGRGKTSLKDCLTYVFGSGHDEDMIHAGAEAGEIIITLSDGGALRAQSSRKTNETKRSWRKPGERKWNASRALIDKIATAISYDAMAFMTMKPAQQVETLLKILPQVVIDQADVLEAVGEAGPEAMSAQISPQMGDLEKLDQIAAAIYDRRRECNVAADTQTKHASELERALPPPDADGAAWTSKIAELKHALAELNEAEQARIAELGKTFTAEKDRLADWMADESDKINSDIDAKIRALEQERDVRLGEIRKLLEFAVETARATANTEVSKLRAVNAPLRQQIVSDLATAEERSREYARTEGSRDAAVKARLEASEKRARSEILTAALERLKDLRVKAAEKLPIRDVTISEGRIWDGAKVPFQRWNTAQQMIFCLKIAVLAHGDAGFVCIDNGEHFDSEIRQAMVAACRKYAETEGMQFIICSVTDGPGLEVKAG